MIAPDVVLLKRAVLAFRSGDKPTARELLAEAAEHNPDNELVWLWTASAARTRSEAFRAVTRVLELNPRNEKALQWIEKLRPGQSDVVEREAEKNEAQEIKAASNGTAAVVEETVEKAEEEEAIEEVHAEETVESEETDQTAAVEQAAESAEVVEEAAAAVVEEEAADAGVEEETAEEAVEQVTLVAAEESAPEDDAESRLAALEAYLDRGGQEESGEPGEEAAHSVDGYGLGAEHETGQDAIVEDEDASDDVWGRLTRTEEQAGPEGEAGDDPLTALLDSTNRENASPSLPKPKAAAQEEEDDIWASLGMAGMEQAAPSSKTSVEPGEAAAAVAAEAADERAAEETPAAAVSHKVDVNASAPNDAELQQDAACFICEKLAPPQEGFCSACRAIVDLRLLDLAPRHEGADRAQLNVALERVRDELEKKPSAKLCIQAALICLNLRQSQQARLYLREACRLRPHDRELVGYYDQIEKRPLILAVDDSKTVQKMISTVLEKESYRVVQAEDGLGAIAKLDEEMPRLILLDITMPRMDGYQVCKVITGNDATKHIPVIMLSGKDGFFDKVRGKMVGASNYITKPFDPSELTKTIAKFLKN